MRAQFFNHVRQMSKVSATGAGPCELIARNPNSVAIFNSHNHAEQNQRRERNDRVEWFVRRTISHGHRCILIRCSAHDQFPQLINRLRCGYELTLPVIWTSAGPFSILTGAGDTGSASGKKRSSL